MQLQTTKAMADTPLTDAVGARRARPDMACIYVSCQTEWPRVHLLIPSGLEECRLDRHQDLRAGPARESTVIPQHRYTCLSVWHAPRACYWRVEPIRWPLPVCLGGSRGWATCTPTWATRPSRPCGARCSSAGRSSSGTSTHTALPRRWVGGSRRPVRRWMERAGMWFWLHWREAQQRRRTTQLPCIRWTRAPLNAPRGCCCADTLLST